MLIKGIDNNDREKLWRIVSRKENKVEGGEGEG